MYARVDSRRLLALDPDQELLAGFGRYPASGSVLLLVDVELKLRKVLSRNSNAGRVASVGDHGRG